jgi:hypothetical protein
MAGGTDVAASFSASASQTAGLRTDNQYRYGDVIVGAPKPSPPWLWMVLAGVILAGFTVWAVRR